ncbi:MFS general substrate transporter [Exidia glandulosa HHB12029]|uniref:MFS general substrate transporter n=1 Tax=Exidia glandulosa HHB12029 TaxID=1314781 RepID=A0A165F1X4_EXIGL|nr:MFS general substrate transporter [Exidia glandulosa HHB12029]
MAAPPVVIAVPPTEAAAPAARRHARFNFDSMDPDVTRRPSFDDVGEFSLSPTARVSQEHVDVVEPGVAEDTKDAKGATFTEGNTAAPSIIGDSSMKKNKDHDPDDFNEKLRTKLEQGIKEQEGDDEFIEGGFRGWIVTIGCSMLVSVTLGWGLCWGVFQEYYRTNLFPNTPQATLSLIGSLSGTVMTLIVFPLGKLGDYYGYKPFLIVGCYVAVLAMFTAAWSHTVWQFAITQASGVLQGIACGFIFPMVTAIPAQYFKRKRGFALGIVMGGSTLGGGIASIIVRTLLTKVGLRNTLLIYTGIHFVIVTIGLLAVRERKIDGQPIRKPSKVVWYDKELLHDKVFWGVVAGLFFSVFGYLPAVFYLVTYAKDTLPGLSPSLTVLPVTLLNIAATCGRIGVGIAADKIGPTNAFIISVTFAGLAQLLIWNFAASYAAVIAFSIICGAFGGCFVSLTGPVAAHVFGAERLAGLSGLLTLFNTPGNVAAAPLAGVIFAASGGNWHALIAYSGSVQIIAGACMLYVRLKREPRIFAIY